MIYNKKWQTNGTTIATSYSSRSKWRGKDSLAELSVTSSSQSFVYTHGTILTCAGTGMIIPTCLMSWTEQRSTWENKVQCGNWTRLNFPQTHRYLLLSELTHFCPAHRSTHLVPVVYSQTNMASPGLIKFDLSLNIMFLNNYYITFHCPKYFTNLILLRSFAP